MSFDIELLDEKGKRYPLPAAMKKGGTMELGGNKDTWLNITYNYSWYYRMFLDKEYGLRWLYDKKAKDCIDRLEAAIKPFPDAPLYDKDYWAPTPGNCVEPLKILLEWAKKHPEGTFRGTD